MAKYSDKVLSYFNDHRNGGMMDNPDAIGQASVNGRAPYVTIYLRVSGGYIVSARFQAFGCGATIASASVLIELVTGVQLSECNLLNAETIINALDGLPPEKEFCAELAVQALQSALANLNLSPQINL